MNRPAHRRATAWTLKMTAYFNAHALGLALAAATLLGPAQSAGAQPDEPSISVRVSVADLDMTFAYERCRADAINQAVSDVNAPIGAVRLMAVTPVHRGGPE